MSLSAQEQLALDSIETGLTRSDPKLASLLATFTRLTSGERMPVHERIRPPWSRPARRWHRNPRYSRLNRAGQPASGLCRRLGWEGVMLLLGLTAVIAVAAVTLITNGGGRGSVCTGSRAFASAQQMPMHSSRPASASR
jgi:hypothetical protein